MTICIHVSGKRRVVCAGDLNKRITLQGRSITPPIFGSADFTETFAAGNERWAAINTIAGKTIFDGMNQKDVALTHEIFIRYDATVTAETWILYNGRRFDIAAVEDMEERHEWMRLLCTDKMTSTV